MGARDEHEPDRVLIIGAGHAGTAAAGALRRQGYAGRIALVGDEPEYPYHRPPVSKGYLGSDPKLPQTEPDLLRAKDWYQKQEIDLRLGGRVVDVDVTARQATLADGTALRFDHLVLATGARARLLPEAAGIAGCCSLRTYQDALAFKRVLEAGSRLVVIGGGFIGLEVAAAARARGCDVTVVERERKLLQRVASATLSESLTSIHRGRGVAVLTSASVSRVNADEGGAVASVDLADGSHLPCDAVVVGVGAAPDDELAQAIGVHCDGGVIVDSGCRTNVPSVYAIGDVTSREVPGHSGRHRLESVPNTTEQANQVAAAITGRPAPPPEVPWFWSDQYEHTLKIVGLMHEADSCVTRGDPGSDSFAVYHYSPDEHLVAVEALNAPRDFMAAKRFLSDGISPPPTQVQDTTVELRELVAVGKR